MRLAIREPDSSDPRKPLALATAAAAIICALAVGCASRPTVEDVRSHNRERLASIRLGMTRSEVLSAMGTDTVQTYRRRQFQGTRFEYWSAYWKISNPYRSETMVLEDGANAEILFYYTDLKKGDHALTDDELTPIILKGDKVIGWGWSFLKRGSQRYKIELRER